MRDFWRVKGVFSTRHLALMGLFIALSAALAVFNTYLSGDFRILSFTFLPMAVGSALLGPWAGMVMGFTGDFLAFLVKPMPPYHPGFALSYMLQNLIYALFLYRRRITWLRVAAAQVVTLPVVTLGLNMLWLNMLYGRTAGELYTFARVWINLALLLVHIPLLYLFSRLVVRLDDNRNK